MKKLIIGTIAGAFFLPSILFSQEQNTLNIDQSARARKADTSESSQYRRMVDDASEAYAAVVKGSQGAVPASVLKNARCIAILPNMVTGAFVVGGTHGDGLASCKVDNNRWSHPAAITLSKGSVGLQAGLKVADLVLFFQTDKAVQGLKRGEVTLGSDVSAVAGKYDADAELSGAGVVAYTHSKGLFAGASINGSQIGKNQSTLETYYGKKVNYLNVLEGRELSDTDNYAQKMIKLFPVS